MWFSVLLLLLLGEQLTSATCCPSNCSCTQEGALKCRGNITGVPSPMPFQTSLLQLIQTQITILDPQSLRRLPLLLRLEISNSPLRNIHSATFEPIPQLLSLKLSSNRLSTLSKQVFSKLNSLQQLFLNGNELESVHPDLFEALVNLTLLDLSENHLTHLDQNIFRSLESLRFLNLGKNSLKELPASIFGSLVRLQYLILYFNKLEFLQARTFENLTNLLQLDLFNNSIRELPPRLFCHLPKLTRLTLSKNKLKSIPHETFYNLPEMTILSIYRNPLIFLPDQLIGHMPRLRQFYLYDTELETVPENLFANMTGLEILSVEFNKKLWHLPENIFHCLSSLYRLNLQANSLQSLSPELFSGLTSLNTLLLNSNKLRSLPSEIFHDLKRLTHVSLHSNQFDSLPGEVLSVALLREATLRDNPWNCTCDILDFVKWIIRRRSIIKDYEHVLCQAPSHLQNNFLGSLTSELVQCGNDLGEMAPEFAVDGSHTMPNRLDGQIVTHNTTRDGMTTAVATSETQSVAQTAAILTSSFNTPMLPHTPTEDHPPGSSPSILSAAFYETIILEAENRIVHHNRFNGWVYLWTLPPSGPYSVLLVLLHVVLVATGMALLVFSVCALYRLNQAIGILATLAVPEKVKN